MQRKFFSFSYIDIHIRGLLGRDGEREKGEQGPKDMLGEERERGKERKEKKEKGKDFLFSLQSFGWGSVAKDRLTEDKLIEVFEHTYIHTYIHISYT